MQKFTAFINKYGIVFHSLSILFWLWIISNGILRMQTEALPLTKKIAFGGVVMFLFLSIFNLYMAIKRRKQD
jgi:cell division protein FtsW (lipid II flippase)